MREIVKKLSILSRRCGIHLDRKLKELRITKGQLMYLMCICEGAGLSQEQLSEELWINKGAVARAVQKFERDGYINRVVCEKDRRQYGLFPTEKTERIYSAIREIEAQWEKYMMRNLTTQQQDTLSELLERLMQDME